MIPTSWPRSAGTRPAPFTKDGWTLTLTLTDENAVGSVSDPDGCETPLRVVLWEGEVIAKNGRTRKVPQGVQLWLEDLFTGGWSPKRVREFVARGCRPPAKVQSVLRAPSAAAHPKIEAAELKTRLAATMVEPSQTLFTDAAKRFAAKAKT